METIVLHQYIYIYTCSWFGHWQTYLYYMERDIIHHYINIIQIASSERIMENKSLLIKYTVWILVVVQPRLELNYSTYVPHECSVKKNDEKQTFT